MVPLLCTSNKVQGLQSDSREGVIIDHHLIVIIPLGRFYYFNLLSLATHLHPSTEIPVLNDPLSQVQNCTHDVIQVAQFYAACCKKYYACILLDRQWRSLLNGENSDSIIWRISSKVCCQFVWLDDYKKCKRFEVH